MSLSSDVQNYLKQKREQQNIEGILNAKQQIDAPNYNITNRNITPAISVNVPSQNPQADANYYRERAKLIGQELPQSLADPNDSNYYEAMAKNTPNQSFPYPQFTRAIQEQVDTENAPNEQDNVQGNTQETPVEEPAPADNAETQPVSEGQVSAESAPAEPVRKQLVDPFAQLSSSSQAASSNPSIDSSRALTNKEQIYNDLHNMYNDKDAMINDSNYLYTFYNKLRQAGVGDAVAKQTMQNLGLENSIKQARSNNYLDLYKKAIQGEKFQDADFILAQMAADPYASSNMLNVLGKANIHGKDIQQQKLQDSSWFDRTKQTQANDIEKLGINHQFQKELDAQKHQDALQKIYAMKDAEMKNYVKKAEFDIKNKVHSREVDFLDLVENYHYDPEVAKGLVFGTNKKGSGGGGGTGAAGENDSWLDNNNKNTKALTESAKTYATAMLAADPKWNGENDETFQRMMDNISKSLDDRDAYNNNQSTLQYYQEYGIDQESGLINDYPHQVKFIESVIDAINNGSKTREEGAALVKRRLGDMALPLINSQDFWRRTAGKSKPQTYNSGAEPTREWNGNYENYD